MRESIEKIYDDLFNDYLSGNRYSDRYIRKRLRNPKLLDSERNSLRTIKNQIEKVGNQLPKGIRLRADAKFFMTIIFQQMIALPLLEEENNEIINQLEKYISDDLSYLVNQSFQYKMLKQDSLEISAHTILTIMDRDWKKMNIAKFSLWND